MQRLEFFERIETRSRARWSDGKSTGSGYLASSARAALRSAQVPPFSRAHQLRYADGCRNPFLRRWLSQSMDIEITFPGGKRVDAQVGGFTVATDQPVTSGGGGSAPAPFDLFLASLATCAGIYVVGFCQTRGIPTDHLRILQRSESDPTTGRLLRVTLEVRVPPDFPAQYRDAVARAAASCKVKKTLANPPAFEVTTAVECDVRREAA
jgi:ribosomal protein S12 methylthiotransferase accessory factor